MDPRARVHITTGILPKRSVELPSRARSAAQSAKEAFFQVAPLISPGGDVSMPLPSDDFGKWSWAYRPQVTMWQEADKITDASDRAGFHPSPQELSEGWLKLKMNPVAILSFWVKEGMLEVPMNTNITLAWVLQGGDRLTLLANDNEKEPVKVWNASPLPEQHRVQVKADITYTLILLNKDNSRAEKRLTIRLAKGKFRLPRRAAALYTSTGGSSGSPAPTTSYSICRSSHDKTSSSIATSVPPLALNEGAV